MNGYLFGSAKIGPWPPVMAHAMRGITAVVPARQARCLRYMGSIASRAADLLMRHSQCSAALLRDGIQCTIRNRSLVGEFAGGGSGFYASPLGRHHPHKNVSGLAF